MRSICGALTMAAVVCPAATPAQAAPSPALHCSLVTRVVPAAYAEFPPAIRSKIGSMAERDQPFQVTDVIIPGQPNPGRRIISGGHRGRDWFLWYEQGGVAYSWHVAVFRLGDEGAPHVLANALVPVSWSENRWKPRIDVCALIDGALAGHVPPYPPGAFPTTYF
jgi:hypothetical protein